MSHGYDEGVNGLAPPRHNGRPTLTTEERGRADWPNPDPFNNLREQREKKKQSGFEFDPFSVNKNLID